MPVEFGWHEIHSFSKYSHDSQTSEAGLYHRKGDEMLAQLNNRAILESREIAIFPDS